MPLMIVPTVLAALTLICAANPAVLVNTAASVPSAIFSVQIILKRNAGNSLSHPMAATAVGTDQNAPWNNGSTLLLLHILNIWLSALNHALVFVFQRPKPIRWMIFSPLFFSKGSPYTIYVPPTRTK